MPKKWSELFNLENTDERLVEFFSEDKPFTDAFKCLFENASDAIYILDKNGNFVTVNRKAEELTGFRREDFVGKSFRKIIPIRSLSNAIKGFLDVIRGKEIRLELELKTATKKTAKRRSQSSFKLVSRNWKKRKLRPKRHGAGSSLPHFHIFT